MLTTITLAVVPASSRLLVRSIDSIGQRLQEKSTHALGLIALLAAAIFAAFPIATRVYGDSLPILRNHGIDSLDQYLHDLSGVGIKFRGAAVLVLHELLSRVFHISLASCYQITGALCGGTFVYVLARLASRIPEIPLWVRVSIVWLGLTDGANQLFFGHVETYAVPRLFSCLFLTRMVSSLLDPKNTPPPESVTSH